MTPTPRIISAAEAEREATFHAERGIHDVVLATGEHQELIWAKFEPGSAYSLHSHPYEQTSVMLHGRMRLTVGDEVREIGPGDMWFAPANVVHGGKILGDKAVVFIDVYAPPSGGIGKDLTRADEVT